MSPPDSPDGPELLAERSVLGVFIHPITLLTGFFGIGIMLAAVVYLLSSHQFTRANARNALNWHLSVFGVATVGIVLFVLGADDLTTTTGQTVSVSLLPEPLATVFAHCWWCVALLGWCWESADDRFQYRRDIQSNLR